MKNTALERQADKIEEFRRLAKPYKKQVAGLQITVLPHVFPGGTDTALLCDSMIISKGDDVLDLCTGNGVVALAAASKGARSVTGTDLNPAAVENANLNKQRLGYKNVAFLETDLFPPSDKKYDVITANIPYSDNRAPDKTAIMFWDEDNKVLKSFFKNLRRYLKPEGKAFLTWSSFAEQMLPHKLADENKMSVRLVGTRSSEKSGFEYYVYEITPKA